MRKLPPGERARRKFLTAKAWRIANRPALLEKKRAYYRALISANPNYAKENYQRRREHVLAYMKKYVADGRQRQRETGHSPAYFKDQLSKQHGLCPICQTELNKKNSHADHDHKTNATRGVLCRSCNMGLGHFKDNREFILAAFNYLEKWG